MYISKPYKGRPVDMEKRQDNEKRCYDFLDSIAVEYEVVDHDEASDIKNLFEDKKVIIKKDLAGLDRVAIVYT